MRTAIHPYRFYINASWSFIMLMTAMICQLPPDLELTPMQAFTAIIPTPLAVALLASAFYTIGRRRMRTLNYALAAGCVTIGLLAITYIANQY